MPEEVKQGVLSGGEKTDPLGSLGDLKRLSSDGSSGYSVQHDRDSHHVQLKTPVFSSGVLVTPPVNRSLGFSEA